MSDRAGGIRWMGRMGIALVWALALPGVAVGEEGLVGEDGPAVRPLRMSEIREAGLYLRTGEAAGYLPAPALAAEVEIRVTGLIARARVSQRFVNRSGAWVEGVYVFPLPETAAVDGLRLVVGERVIAGEIREREEAKRVYAQAKSAGVKASLVEQERPNLFTTSVANLGPGEEVEVAIEYQQTVDYDRAGFHLRFPTVVAPRYAAGVPDAGRIAPPVAVQPRSLGAVVASAVGEPFAGPVRAAVDRLADAAVPPGADNPLRLAVEIDAGLPLETVASPHHDFTVEALGGRRFRVALAGGPVAADRDFELTWTPRLGAEPDAALFTETVDGEVYALLMVVPPDPETAGFVPLPRETIFVVDTSGSMHGASLAQAKAALVTALDRLRSEDSFNVIEFNSVARALFPGSLPADPATVEQARRWVAGLAADGGTEMLPALAAALEAPPPGYRRAGERAVKQVIFITDGAVGNEEELFAAIESKLGAARLFTVGIGSAPNSYFMRRAAEAGRGTFTYVGHPGEVRAKMGALFAKLEAPVLTDLEVVWDDPGAEVWPARIPDLYAGEPLVLAARVLDIGDELRITGWRDGRPWERRLGGEGRPYPSVAVRSQDASGVGKLWARRKIEALVGGLRRGAAPDEVRRQVVEVALAHHLVSRYTSLVAVDVTPARPAGEPLATEPLPVALPAGWTAPGELPAGGTAARLQRALGLLLLLPAVIAGLVGLFELRRRALRPLPVAASARSRA